MSDHWAIADIRVAIEDFGREVFQAGSLLAVNYLAFI
jgi:hypothetical protein